MALEKTELQPSSSWFLTARRGDLSLRVQQRICIGEDDTGDLTLGSNPEGRLIECSVALGQLTLRVLSDNTCLRDKNGNHSVEVQLDQGEALTLDLPHNAIRLSGDFGTTNHTRHLRLLLTPAEEIPPPAPLPVPRRQTSTAEFIGIPDAAAIAPAAPARTIPTLIQRVSDHSVPDTAEIRPAIPEPASTGELLAPILVQEAVAEITAERHPAKVATRAHLEPVRSSTSSSLGLILLGLLLLALGGGDAMLVTPSNTSANGLESSAAEKKGLVLLGSNASVLVTDLPPPIEPARRPPPTIEPVVSEIVHPPVIVERQLSAAAQRMIEIRLQQARDYLRSGDIISPTDANAVMTLSRILGTDPTNAEALALMVQCADELLQQARDAQSAGDLFAARNLVEEVLAFHPTYAAANRLWEELTEPPES